MKKVILLMLTISFLSCGKDSNLITGNVSNTNGNPVENVLVQVMGTDLNSRTNAKGEFKINTRNRGDELIFTHSDYEMRRINLSDESQYSVKLIKRNNQ
ncbi:carboxypeptidase-like regulatory domain-containing protein [Psychroflexus sp. CAK57W]|uniref:carboxypeptidase-like regulatory domain-containing protein n=1 Tax=Psychroflexus curvus TaxID=2873595 RepID=UPI001CCB209F|nr:carboxypeptidase-like regulatory domain-containing protein [Psychroflexus curvus]MBZ9786616.1 carboxypeptidase-like regulatory domain-containing protein [Psychroflexus curvus]